MKKTIILYGIPAYGHIHANLCLAKLLVKEGFRVVYYATDSFRQVIEANGCEYRSYPLEREQLDLSDGKRIPRLYRLLLQYTQKMLPVLLMASEIDRPCCVIFDSLALWGRIVGTLHHVPAFSFYSLAAVGRPGDAGFWMYAWGFWKKFLQYGDELPRALRTRNYLEQTYRINGLGLMDVLMGKGDRNLMGYSRTFQPGGENFDASCLFLGPLSIHREVVEVNDFDSPREPIIYISLGTIFNQDPKLLNEVIRQFGEWKGDKTDTGSFARRIVMVDMGKTGKEDRQYPDNFIVRSFVNQGEILARASLFITSGGLNSIHEALYYKVPCLLCPQQGEQLVNARRFAALGYGRILKRLPFLREEAERTMELKEQWNENLRRELLEVHMEEALTCFRRIRDTGRMA